MANTTTPAHTFTAESVEVETTTDGISLVLWDPADPATLGAVLNLSEQQALEVGLLLIQAHHAVQAARIARGERRAYSEAEIEDAHTLAARYPRPE